MAGKSGPENKLGISKQQDERIFHEFSSIQTKLCFCASGGGPGAVGITLRYALYVEPRLKSLSETSRQFAVYESLSTILNTGLLGFSIN